MPRTLALALLLALPAAALADDVKAEAQALLDKGAKLFDARDSAALAATYTEDAQVHWFAKDESTGEFKDTVKDGRGAIEALYLDFFKEPKDKTTSRNVVESARLVAPDLMIVQGTFQPDVDKPGKYPFVQVRVKQGDQWLMKALQLFIVSQD